MSNSICVRRCSLSSDRECWSLLGSVGIKSGRSHIVGSKLKVCVESQL